MSVPHLLLVWLHLLAAIIWIGGMLFLSLVLAPAYRSIGRAPDATTLFRSTAGRFRYVAWGAVAALLLTGPLLALDRGWSLFEPNRWPSLLAVKASLVGMLILATAVHDVLLGSRVRTTLEIPSDKRTSADRILLLSASWLPRLSIVIALLVIVAAAMLARS